MMMKHILNELVFWLTANFFSEDSAQLGFLNFKLMLS